MSEVWVGYASATEEQIATLEVRIGTRLPPSYRQFLAVSNGWRDSGAFIYKLWSTEDVDWFRVRNKEWIDISNSSGTDERDPEHESRDMKTALEISDIGDSAILLLNPQVISPEGEWEAWFFSSWSFPASRYPSFWELMHAQFDTMTRLSAHESKRLSAKADLTQLPAKLPGLVAELREKAAQWASMPSSFIVKHNQAQAEALNDVANEVQKLINTPRVPAEMLAALRAIAERAEHEYATTEASGQTHLESAMGDTSNIQGDPAQAMSRLGELVGRMNLGEAAEGMTAKGRAQGMSSAAAIIRWFINDYPA